MAAEPSTKAKAWAIFDKIVADAAPAGEHSNPWVKDEYDRLLYEPDYDTLKRLLGVPLYLKAPTTTGVPALALDVWLSYELRRAGFDADAVWRLWFPRGQSPWALGREPDDPWGVPSEDSQLGALAVRVWEPIRRAQL